MNHTWTSVGRCDVIVVEISLSFVKLGRTTGYRFLIGPKLIRSLTFNSHEIERAVIPAY